MLRVILSVVLVVIIAFSVSRIMQIMGEYNRANEVAENMLVYKPGISPGEKAAPVVNQGVIDAQNEINGDIVGWLTIPGTAVDYLFVQAADNDYYLGTDLYGRSASAGSIFMDARNKEDFSDFNTILYGHHMKNGSMFQSLTKFAEGDFFEANLTGMIFLPYETYLLRIFAYMVIQADDAVIYGSLTEASSQRNNFFDYVEKNALRFRDLGFTDQDRVVTLSSCSYAFNDARMVLLARLEEPNR